MLREQDQNAGPQAPSAPEWQQQRVAALQGLFPEAFSEGKVDLQMLQAALGEDVETGPERYSFTWAGKRDAMLLLQTPSRATLIPDQGESVRFEDTGNIFIEGENLEVLKLLYKSYFGRVKMIYIDPPYNTGNDFVYPDNYTDPLDTYLKLTGQKDGNGNLLTSNPETSGRYHSSWLSMMYPRLFLARQLLREDGVIFVSIDDHEVHNLRMLMNQVLGEENLVVQIAWQSRQSMQNDTDISVNHEYILGYAKMRRQAEHRLKEKNADVWATIPGFAAYPLPLDPKGFTNPDGDPRGPWTLHPFDAPNIRPNLTYAIVNPKTGQEHWPPTGRCWGTDEASYKRLLDDWRIMFGRSGDARPQRKVFYEERKAFGQVENTWFSGDKHGTATHGTRELQSLFDGQIVFDSPKPSTLIRSLLRITTREQDIVVDFFAGSGTTAHALLGLNREDGGNRRFVMVQLPEPTPVDSQPRKLGYNTIADIGKERIRRVIAKMQKENEGKLLAERETPEDLGFRVFKLVTSNYRSWAGVAESTPQAYGEQIALYADPLVEGWTAENVLYEVAIREGYGLNCGIEKVQGIEGNTVYRVADTDKGQWFHICLDDALRPATLKALDLTAEHLFICRDKALDDEAAANLALQCRLKTI
jgi:adenine-specific DNA-methyltransferase